MFHATPETITKPTVVRRQFVCGGNISEGTTPNLWGCAQHYARQDELNAHFRSPLGRRCIKQYVEAHISRPDHSMMIDSIPPGVEQALSRDQVSVLQLMKNAKPETVERVQGSGQQLLRAEDVLKLICINDDQKTKYKPLFSSLWSIMKNKPQDSQEHRQARARLAEWSQKLIAQERIARQKAQQAAQQAGNRPQSQQGQQAQQGQGGQGQGGQGQQRQPLQNAPSQTQSNPQGTQPPQINPEIMQHVQSFPLSLPPGAPFEGTAEYDKQLREMRNSYLMALNKQEMATYRVKNLNQLIKQHIAQGQYVTQELINQKAAAEQDFKTGKQYIEVFRRNQTLWKGHRRRR